MNAATRSAREAQPCRFYAPDYRRKLRDAGAFATLSASANVVLAALCDRANAAGVAWPSVETIARDYGLGESTVRRALAELVACGLVLAVRRAGKVSRYVLATPNADADSEAQGAQDGSDPARIGPPPRSNRAPIMTIDHDQDHPEQHDNGAGRTVVVVVERPLAEESAAAAPAAEGIEKDAAEPDMIALLTPDLVERARALGLQPAKVNRFGAARVRAVFDALEAERPRKAIGNPAGWAMRALEGQWALPGADEAGGRPDRMGAAPGNRPPMGVARAREKSSGIELEVLDVNEVRVQLVGGVAVPAHRWDDWEWLAGQPAQAPVDLDHHTTTAASDSSDAERRGVLARVAAWAAIRPRTAGEVEAKLTAAGVALDEWAAYRADLDHA